MVVLRRIGSVWHLEKHIAPASFFAQPLGAGSHNLVPRPLFPSSSLSVMIAMAMAATPALHLTGSARCSNLQKPGQMRQGVARGSLRWPHLRRSTAGRGMGRARRAEMKGQGGFIVGGNWKCNGDTATLNSLVSSFNGAEIDGRTEVVCFPPFVHIGAVQQGIRSDFAVGAQNAWTGKGAYTGEVAAEMLPELGINWVILGHSERRSIFGESNEDVGKKVAHALSCGLNVIACIGEKLDEREANKTFEVVKAQLDAIAQEVNDWSNIVIAYEPVWAIGTGRVATPEQAQEVHAYIRQWFHENAGESVAKQMRIQYGGSVNADNCEELSKQEDIDGFLVGGASLKSDQFVAICNSVKAKS